MDRVYLTLLYAFARVSAKHNLMANPSFVKKRSRASHRSLFKCFLCILVYLGHIAIQMV
jgi:hypothetical protein